MNAIVEVATVEVVAQASKVDAISTFSHYLPVLVPTLVATSTLRVPSLGSHSISAVAPDAYFKIGGLAVA